MTLTTVGYDYNPETLLGKILGGCCALSGVILVFNTAAHKLRLFSLTIKQCAKTMCPPNCHIVDKSQLWFQ